MNLTKTMWYKKVWQYPGGEVSISLETPYSSTGVHTQDKQTVIAVGSDVNHTLETLFDQVQSNLGTKVQGIPTVVQEPVVQEPVVEQEKPKPKPKAKAKAKSKAKVKPKSEPEPVVVPTAEAVSNKRRELLKALCGREDKPEFKALYNNWIKATDDEKVAAQKQVQSAVLVPFITRTLGVTTEQFSKYGIDEIQQTINLVTKGA